MNLDELRYRSRRLIDRLRSGELERQKLIALALVLVVLVLFIALNLWPALRPRPVATEPQSAGWTAARELNAQLRERGFHDVEFAVESERPLKFGLVGGVMTEDDLEELQRVARELRPEGDYDVRVEVIELMSEEDNVMPADGAGATDAGADEPVGPDD
ncbi:MAG TPA: hypothetical protein VD963_06910 [Phycisphaerales bacterium]|nr:hypothetical protein [Phycisphaerales bacterium]